MAQTEAQTAEQLKYMQAQARRGQAVNAQVMAGQQNSPPELNNTEQQRRAADIKQAQRQAINEQQAEPDERPYDAARRMVAEKESAKAKAKEGIKKAVTSPVSAGTKWLLRISWESMSTVVGFVFLGLPYINLHVFGRLTLGENFFCKLGDEWKPAYSSIADAFETESRWLGLIEAMALLFFDLVVLFCIMGVLFLIYIIVSLMSAESWWDKIVGAYQAFKALGFSNSLKALVELF